MAKSFNINAKLRISKVDAKPAIGELKKQLSGIKTVVKIDIKKSSVRQVAQLNSELDKLRGTLSGVASSAQATAGALRNIAGLTNTIKSVGINTASTNTKIAKSMKAVATDTRQARTEFEEFGRQGALAVRRFASFTIATGIIFGFINAVRTAASEAISFERELVRVAQVTRGGAGGLKNLTTTITQLSTTLGVSSKSLIEVSRILAQTGLSARDTQIALTSLAKTELAPTFTDIKRTAEGAIAAMAQFGIGARQLESILGSINAVAGQFAVESDDIIAAVRRTGGVFAAASKNVSQGSDALNEFIAVFTAVRSTTRESAESIATGLRTIFTRLQRRSTLDFLDSLGVKLTDLEGRFIGPFQASVKLGEALATLASSGDVKFFQIQEELGGFRQIGKVIPLLTQTNKINQALAVAQKGQTSLDEDVIKAQETLAVRLSATREEFIALIREISETSAFKTIADATVRVTEGLIGLGRALKPVLPILALFGTFKALSVGFQFFKGFAGGIKSTGGVAGLGQGVAQAATGGGTAASGATRTALQANTSALTGNNSAINNLRLVLERLTTTLATRTTKGFASGGLVPGSGSRDTVPAMLTPGEFVLRKNAVKEMGIDSAFALNKFAEGDFVRSLTGKNKQELAAIFAGRGASNIGASKAAKAFLNGQTNESSLLNVAGIGTKAQTAANQRVVSLGTPGVPRVGGLFLRPISGSADSQANLAIEDRAKIDAILTAARAQGNAGLPKSSKEIQGGRIRVPADLNFIDPALAKGALGSIIGGTRDAIAKVAAGFGGRRKSINASLRNANKEGVFGSLFQAAIDSVTGAGVDTARGAQGGGFDFDNAGGKLTNIFGNVKAPFVDAKLTNNAENRQRLKNKAAAVLLGQSGRTRQGSLSRSLVALAGGGGIGGTDSVPALLTPGEFVVNKQAAQALGASTLRGLNNIDRKGGGGRIKKFQNGGFVDQLNIATRGSADVGRPISAAQRKAEFQRELQKERTARRQAERRQILPQLRQQQKGVGLPTNQTVDDFLKESAEGVKASVARQTPARAPVIPPGQIDDLLLQKVRGKTDRRTLDRRFVESRTRDAQRAAIGPTTSQPFSQVTGRTGESLEVAQTRLRDTIFKELRARNANITATDALAKANVQAEKIAKEDLNVQRQVGSAGFVVGRSTTQLGGQVRPSARSRATAGVDKFGAFRRPAAAPTSVAGAGTDPAARQNRAIALGIGAQLAAGFIGTISTGVTDARGRGAVGGVQGAVSGAGALASFGAVGGAVGAVGGGVIGGIQSFIDATVTNAFTNLDEAAKRLDESFNKLSENFNKNTLAEFNAELAKSALAVVDVTDAQRLQRGGIGGAITSGRQARNESLGPISFIFPDRIAEGIAQAITGQSFSESASNVSGRGGITAVLDNLVRGGGTAGAIAQTQAESRRRTNDFTSANRAFFDTGQQSAELQIRRGAGIEELTNGPAQQTVALAGLSEEGRNMIRVMIETGKSMNEIAETVSRLGIVSKNVTPIIDDIRKRQAVERATANTIAQFDLLIEVFKKLDAEISNIANAGLQNRQNSQALAGRFGGGIALRQLNNPSPFANPRGASIDDLRAGGNSLLNNIGRSSTNTDLVNTAVVSEQIRRSLPGIVQGANFSAGADATGTIVDAIQNQFGGTAPPELLNEVIRNVKDISTRQTDFSPQAVIDSLDKLVAGAGASATKALNNLAKQIDAAGNEFINAVQQFTQRQDQINQQEERLLQSRTSNVLKLIEISGREVTTRQRLNAITNPIGIGVGTTDPAAIGGRIRGLRNTQRGAEGAAQVALASGDRQEFARQTSIAAKANSEQARLVRALNNLSNATNELGVIQQRVIKLEEDKKKAQGFLDQLAFSTPEDLNKLGAAVPGAGALLGGNNAGLVGENLQRAAETARQLVEQLLTTGKIDQERARVLRSNINQGVNQVLGAQGGALGVGFAGQANAEQAGLRADAQRRADRARAAARENIDLNREQNNAAGRAANRRFDAQGRAINNIGGGGFAGAGPGGDGGGIGAAPVAASDKFAQASVNMLRAAEQLSNIPETITLTATHTVNVNINGAEALNGPIKDLVIAETARVVKKHINPLNGDVQEGVIV